MLYSFPSAFLLLYDVLKYEDYSAYEAANVLGIPKWSQFLNITLPYLRKPLISAVFATFTLVITDYGVPLMVGRQDRDALHADVSGGHRPFELQHGAPPSGSCF